MVFNFSTRTPFVIRAFVRESFEAPSSIMRLLILALMGIAAHQVSSFPSYLSEAMIQIRSADRQSQVEQAQIETRKPGCPFAKRDPEAEAEPGCPFAKEKRQAPGVTPPFDASQQYVSNTGDHAFVAPGPTDQRGPCMHLATHAPYSLVNQVSIRSWLERNGQPRLHASQRGWYNVRLCLWNRGCVRHG